MLYICYLIFLHFHFTDINIYVLFLLQYTIYWTCFVYSEDNDVDLDPLANQELDEQTAPQKSSGKQKKKKKKDDW